MFVFLCLYLYISFPQATCRIVIGCGVAPAAVATCQSHPLPHPLAWGGEVFWFLMCGSQPAAVQSRVPPISRQGPHPQQSLQEQHLSGPVVITTSGGGGGGGGAGGGGDGGGGGGGGGGGDGLSAWMQASSSLS